MAKQPTKAECRRMGLLKTDVGCAACAVHDIYVTPCDVHHLLSGGRRRGHSATIPLCPWHHRGVEPREWQHQIPSLAKEPRRFRKEYGTDDELLAWTDEKLAAIEGQFV